MAFHERKARELRDLGFRVMETVPIQGSVEMMEHAANTCDITRIIQSDRRMFAMLQSLRQIVSQGLLPQENEGQSRRALGDLEEHSLDFTVNAIESCQEERKR